MQHEMFEVTGANYRFAAWATTLRELSVLFPMMLSKRQDPQAQLFIAMTHMRDQAQSDLNGTPAKAKVLYGFHTYRVKCFSAVIEEVLQAKRTGRLEQYLKRYEAHLMTKLVQAERWLPSDSPKLPANYSRWLLSFPDGPPTEADLDAVFTLSRGGERFFLVQDGPTTAGS